MQFRCKCGAKEGKRCQSFFEKTNCNGICNEIFSIANIATNFVARGDTMMLSSYLKGGDILLTAAMAKLSLPWQPRIKKNEIFF